MTPYQYNHLVLAFIVGFFALWLIITYFSIVICTKLNELLKRTALQGDKKSDPTNELRERLRKYPRPFRVEYFVDHLIVRDGNGSECYRMASEVAAALNMVAEGEK